MAAFTLYSYRRSMAAYRVKVALNFKGVAVSEVEVDLDGGEQFATHIQEHNPEGVVPALLDPDAGLMTQSMSILEYLEERFPSPPLLPTANIAGRARVRSLASLIASDTHPLITHRVESQLMKQTGFDAQAWRQWCVFWLNRGLAAFEARLKNDNRTGTFCHGDQVSIADISLASLVVIAEKSGFSCARYATVTRIVNECRKLESFRQAAPK